MNEFSWSNSDVVVILQKLRSKQITFGFVEQFLKQEYNQKKSKTAIYRQMGLIQPLDVFLLDADIIPFQSKFGNKIMAVKEKTGSESTKSVQKPYFAKEDKRPKPLPFLLKKDNRFFLNNGVHIAHCRLRELNELVARDIDRCAREEVEHNPHMKPQDNVNKHLHDESMLPDTLNFLSAASHLLANVEKKEQKAAAKRKSLIQLKKMKKVCKRLSVYGNLNVAKQSSVPKINATKRNSQWSLFLQFRWFHCLPKQNQQSRVRRELMKFLSDHRKEKWTRWVCPEDEVDDHIELHQSSPSEISAERKNWGCSSELILAARLYDRNFVLYQPDERWKFLNFSAKYESVRTPLVDGRETALLRYRMNHFDVVVENNKMFLYGRFLLFEALFKPCIDLPGRRVLRALAKALISGLQPLALHNKYQCLLNAPSRQVYPECCCLATTAEQANTPICFALNVLEPNYLKSREKFLAPDAEQSIIHRLLFTADNSQKEFYDWRVRPRGKIPIAQVNGSMTAQRLNDQEGDSPLHVYVNMYLRSISKVDDVNMEYTMHFTFRQEWVDERLLFYSASQKHIVLSSVDQLIFLPDTFFQNEKDGKKHSSAVLFQVDFNTFLPMHLEAYPLDTQTCYIDYASYAYTTRDLEYYWKAEKPIQIKPGLRQSLPSFLLSKIYTGNCTSVTNTGTYSCLRTIIRLKREFSYYLLQLYVPSFMLVAVSSVSFWLDKDSVPARVTLGTTVLLTVTTMASGINASLPPVSYTKSVDIWIGVCTGFIFGALLEFSLVNWAARKEAFSSFNRIKMLAGGGKKSINNPLLAFAAPRLSIASGYGVSRASRSNSIRPEDQDLNPGLFTRLGKWWRELWDVRYKEKSRRIDLLARILFPFFFIIFNVIYWIRYLRPYLAEKSEMPDDGPI
uniref:Glutamate-gated chloride channel n=1 Tax=Ditylenchus dipsaci TaxID=166011 RepID=A0A915E9P1_9BILA